MRVRYRWLALFFMCSSICGAYFSFDNPAILEYDIEEKLDVEQTTYSLLYSFYSMPNMVLPFLGGILFDYIGYDKGILITTGLVSAGQCLAAFGGFKESFPLILAGRLMFGFGAETLWVVQAVYLSKWFFDQEMSFAIGINYAVPNIFSTIAGSTVPRIYAKKGFGMALGTGAFLTIVSFCLAVCLVILDKKMVAHDRGMDMDMLMTNSEERPDSRSKSRSTSNNRVGSQYAYGGSMPTQTGNRPTQPRDTTMKISYIKYFEIGFWILILDSTLAYGMVVSSVVVGNDFLMQKFHYSKTAIGTLLITPYTVSVVMMPLMGYIADKVGKRMTLIFLMFMFNVAGHMLNLLLPQCDKCLIGYLPFPLYGFMYTSYVVLMWGSIPYIVPQEKLSTSYGFLTCIVNVFNTFFPLVITSIHDKTPDGSYKWVEVTFLGLCALSLMLKAALYIWD